MLPPQPGHALWPPLQEVLFGRVLGNPVCHSPSERLIVWVSKWTFHETPVKNLSDLVAPNPFFGCHLPARHGLSIILRDRPPQLAAGLTHGTAGRRSWD